MIFLDTSAIYALADRGDPWHGEARAGLKAPLEAGERLLTHNYILVEAMALIQHRLGRRAVVKLAADAQAFEVEWVDPSTYQEVVRRWGRRSSRQVSFVDGVSFLIMRRRGVRTAFVFDADFGAEGFRIFGARG